MQCTKFGICLHIANFYLRPIKMDLSHYLIQKRRITNIIQNYSELFLLNTLASYFSALLLYKKSKKWLVLPPLLSCNFGCQMIFFLDRPFWIQRQRQMMMIFTLGRDWNWQVCTVYPVAVKRFVCHLIYYVETLN